MARIEKTVFISYRRTDVYTALAVYESLKNQGYDVFFDYRSISSGDFEQIISSNIRARAHFILILTPTALERCNEPGDWLRREIETAIDEKRNIVPLLFKGFRFGAPSVTKKLTGRLKNLSRYNGLNVHEDYFDEAMHRLRTQYLSKPLDTVLHPVSNTVQKIVREEQVAADKALEQVEDVKELVKRTDEKPPQTDRSPKPVVSQPVKWETARKILTWRLLAGLVGGLVLIALFIWGGANILNNLSTVSQPTQTFEPISSHTSQPAKINTPFLTQTPIPGLDISSTIKGKDGMTLLFVPAGEFTMGSNNGSDDQRPAHTVYLDAFWIDKTEVTNAMYAKCVKDGNCQLPDYYQSSTRESYYGDPAFDNYPVIYVSWEDAKAYCEWANRRLPTEAEWEKAARGGNAFIYPWGNDVPNNNLLNYNNAVGDTSEVDQYSDGASPYGALDMAGNVSEWVADWYSDTYYSSSLTSNPLGSSSGQFRVLRGGAWNSNDDGIRSAHRDKYDPADSAYTIGFRCAVSAIDLPQSSSSAQPVATATATETSSLGIGSTMRGKDGMTLLYVPAGEFTMGSENGGDNEKPVHTIYLDAFWIDQTEVTNAMYSNCVSDGVCNNPRKGGSYTRDYYFRQPTFDNFPIIYVSWDDAKSYCEWVDRLLPTEAEWEKAARGTDANIYPWGNDVPNTTLLNYGSAVGDTTEVGKYPNGASPYGTLDMAGNVWEWVNDWYDSIFYQISPSSNPQGPASGEYRIRRGGSWFSDSVNVRSVARDYGDPTLTYYAIGFRSAMSANP